MDRVAAKLMISGRVQGVWYRGTMQERAEELGCSGWSRNLFSGEVEAFVEGPRDKVEALIGWCRRGPPSARVESVEVTWTEVENQVGFHIRR